MFICSENSKKDNYDSLKNDIAKELNITFNENFTRNNENYTWCNIDGRLYQTNLILLDSNKLYNIARKQLRLAEESALAEIGNSQVNVADVRQQIVTLLSVCRDALQDCSNSIRIDLVKSVTLLRNSVNSWSKLEESALSKLTSTSVKNDQLIIHHYFHMYLDIQRLTLSICYICNATLDTNTDILKELIDLSSFLYNKRNNGDITQTSAFVCTCVKELWILLQIFSERLFKIGKSAKPFWETFNDLLKEKDEIFSLWLLNNIAPLQGYNEEGDFVGPTNTRVCSNHHLIEHKLKSLNGKWSAINGSNNETLLNCCSLIDPLLNCWWINNRKLEPIQLLWEIFYKHINVSLGTGNDICSAMEIVNAVDSVFYWTKTNDSYRFFLYMLNKYLKELPNQWPKMRGRIYCKLPAQKIKDFSDVGLLNVTVLFLSLTNCVNINEVTQKLVSLLLNLGEERRRSSTVLTIFASIVIVYVRENYSVVEVSTPLIELVENTSVHRELFYLIKLYIEHLDGILNLSSNFCLGQNLLVGRWIGPYMKVCQYKDLCNLLNVLICHIKRIRSAGAWTEWESVLKEYVLSNLKSIATSESSPPQVGQLAALIEGNPSSELVLTFTADSVLPKVTCQFVETLLEHVPENYTLPKSHETAILHVWIRCCLLKCENNAKVTRNVMKLNTLSSIMNPEAVLYENPLCSFITAVSECSLKPINLCEQCFGRLDVWIMPYLKNPPNESIVIHIYTCIGNLVFNCASLLYNKTRSNCLLSRFINTFILSTDVLMGKAPHPFVLSGIQRTWHLFVQGIFTLDFFGDAFLERTLRDMVVRYIILLPVNEFPILKCMAHEKLMVFLLDKISGAFFSRTCKNADGNTTKALKIVHLILRSFNSTNASKIVLKSIVTAVLEVIMFHEPKNMAIDIIKFVSSPNQSEEFRDCLRESLRTVTEKHLAFNTGQYFQFTRTLVKVIPRDMKAVLPEIRNHVAEVERMRGVGFDSTLRQALNKLEVLLE